jgi:hypothetical protein
MYDCVTFIWKYYIKYMVQCKRKEQVCYQETYQLSWPLDIIRKIKVARQWWAVHLQRMGNIEISSRITDFRLKGRRWGDQNFSGWMMKWKGSCNYNSRTPFLIIRHCMPELSTRYHRHMYSIYLCHYKLKIQLLWRQRMNESDLIELFSQLFVTIMSTATAVTHSSFLLQNKMHSTPLLLLIMLHMSWNHRLLCRHYTRLCGCYLMVYG